MGWWEKISLTLVGGFEAVVVFFLFIYSPVTYIININIRS